MSASEEVGGKGRDSKEELVRKYSSLVLSIVRSFAWRHDLAEDLYQEAWRHILSKLESYEGRGSVGGWIRTVVTNFCVSDYRIRVARRKAHQRAESDLIMELDREGASPEQELVRNETNRYLYLALSELTSREYEAVTLRFIEDRSTDEVAHIMSIKQSSVRSMIRHGLNHLRKLLEESRDELSGHQPIH